MGFRPHHPGTEACERRRARGAFRCGDIHAHLAGSGKTGGAGPDPHGYCQCRGCPERAHHHRGHRGGGRSRIRPHQRRRGGGGRFPYAGGIRLHCVEDAFRRFLRQTGGRGAGGAGRQQLRVLFPLQRPDGHRNGHQDGSRLQCRGNHGPAQGQDG
ncbi:unknown [Akkermansia muciniphila CAG:154]|nr:unknown [Akkermansia muciniphila CAG:154]